MNTFYFNGMGGVEDDWKEILSSHTGTVLKYHSPLSLNRQITLLAQENARFADSTLCGYSMGGRIAILLASRLLQHGIQPKKVILLSSGLGFSSNQERESRHVQDYKWISIARENPAAFWSSWYEQEIFNGFKEIATERRKEWLQRRNSIHFEDLYRDLVLFSPANHEFLLPVLQEIHRRGVSVLYIAGERDKKILANAEMMKKEGIGRVEILPQVGHILPLEAPQLCAKWI